MFKTVFRVLSGFLLACLAAGVAQVMFAVGPQEALEGDPDRLATILTWMAHTATHSAVFAAPFAFLAAAVSEWQGIRGVVYHLLAGIGIAAAGFAAQYFAQPPDGESILNGYALAAYGATGLIGGLFYWMFAGRYAQA